MKCLIHVYIHVYIYTHIILIILYDTIYYIILYYIIIYINIINIILYRILYKNRDHLLLSWYKLRIGKNLERSTKKVRNLRRKRKGQFYDINKIYMHGSKSAAPQTFI